MNIEYPMQEWLARFGDCNKDYFLDNLYEASWWDLFPEYDGEERCAEFTERVIPVLRNVINSPLFDKDKCYIFFKQSLRGDGVLYESVKICDIQSKDVLYTIDWEDDAWSVLDFVSEEGYDVTQWKPEALKGVSIEHVFEFFKV